MTIFRSTKRMKAFTVPEGMEIKLYTQEWWKPTAYSSTEIRVKNMSTRKEFDVPVEEFKSGMERVQ